MTTPAGESPRYAWYGRVSTEDEQDPTLSFPRQLQNAERQVAEAGGRIVAHYYDIESGTRTYAARGSGGLAGFDIAIPRDGGLQDLLADAARHPQRFDRVIVESISRLSRNSSVAFRVEDELRSAGVRLCAADEPMEESFGTIVLRHVNIGIARGYHHELMVKSRQGQETSTRQGWHTGGVALYGYRFVIHDHPNPHKASRGINKRTLELDPVRAPVVRTIYDWYLGGGMGLLQVRDRLNAEPERYPPPVPVDPTTARGAWSRSSVWEVLRNPKYTGYQVWNRRARKKGHNRTNPPESWIWSEEPAHPAIVSREEHEAVHARARANERSRQGVPATTARPTAKRDYLYRGLLRCGICGLRMWGNRRRNTTYYSCQPSHQRSKDIPVGHPPHVYLNEQRLNDALLPFLATALFGPERTDYWRLALDAATEPERMVPARERASEIEAEIADLERRIGRQLVNLEADDVTPALRRRVAQRVDELEIAIADRRQRITVLAEQVATKAPTLADVAPLLDRLPLLASSLDTAPQGELRALFDSLQLDVVYQPADSALDVAATLYDLGSETAQSAAPRRAEDWYAPPVGIEPTTPGLGNLCSIH
jgi:site-specific DNA recombinase